MKLEKTLKKVEIDLANLGYSNHVVINELTKDVKRINNVSDRNTFKFDEEIDDFLLTISKFYFLFSLYN
jgi:hypothetical protein